MWEYSLSVLRSVHEYTVCAQCNLRMLFTSLYKKIITGVSEEVMLTSILYDC